MVCARAYIWYNQCVIEACLCVQMCAYECIHLIHVVTVIVWCMCVRMERMHVYRCACGCEREYEYTECGLRGK